MSKGKYDVTITITAEGGSVREAMDAAHNSLVANGLDAGRVKARRMGRVSEANLDALFEDEPKANLDAILG